MIRGVGVDLCPVSRVMRIMARHPGRFEERVFTRAERAYCESRGAPAQHFAARFAAKEAALKALGAPAGIGWHDLEVVATDGAPRLELHGPAAASAAGQGVRRAHLSLSHAGDAAIAFVVLEGADIDPTGGLRPPAPPAEPSGSPCNDEARPRLASGRGRTRGRLALRAPRLHKRK
jgi:holo-[acyl-carrier protein] synthase